MIDDGVLESGDGEEGELLEIELISSFCRELEATSGFFGSAVGCIPWLSYRGIAMLVKMDRRTSLRFYS